MEHFSCKSEHVIWLVKAFKKRLDCDITIVAYAWVLFKMHHINKLKGSNVLKTRWGLPSYIASA